MDLSDSLEFGHFIFALPDLPRDVGQQCHFVDQQTTYATLLSFQMVPQDSVIVCHQEEKQFRSSETTKSDHLSTWESETCLHLAVTEFLTL